MRDYMIKLFHTIFFILVGMGIMYLYMQKQTDPMDQIQKLMSQNDVDPDEAIYIYLKKNPDLRDSQKEDLFLNAINNFTLSEGVFSSMVEMAEDELSSEELTSMIGKLRTRMQQLQHFYYSLKLGNGPEYFTVIKELEFIGSGGGSSNTSGSGSSGSGSSSPSLSGVPGYLNLYKNKGPDFYTSTSVWGTSNYVAIPVADAAAGERIKAILDAAYSQYNQDSISYGATTLLPGDYNSNSLASTLLQKIGLSDRQIEAIDEKLPGTLVGWGKYLPKSAFKE